MRKVFTFICLLPLTTFAQRVDFGLGTGYSWNKDEVITEAFINPQDSLFEVNREDAMLNRLHLSLNIMVYPFDLKTRLPKEVDFLRKAINRIGVVSSVKILELSSDSDFLISKEKLQAGIGVGYKFNDQVFIGFTWDYIKTRELRNIYETESPINIGSNTEILLTSLDLNDDTYFRNQLTLLKSINLIVTF